MPINKISLADLSGTQQGLFQEGFELTGDYLNGGTVELEAGRVAYLAGYPFAPIHYTIDSWAKLKLDFLHMPDPNLLFLLIHYIGKHFYGIC